MSPFAAVVTEARVDDGVMTLYGAGGDPIASASLTVVLGALFSWAEADRDADPEEGES